MHDFSTDPEHWGFIFHPQVDPHIPGHPKMDVFIRRRPTGDHFDPEIVTFDGVSEESNAVRIEVGIGWDWHETVRTLAGCIEITDQKGKEIHAFTFGGEAKIQHDTQDSEKDLLTLSISSPAPILTASHEKPGTQLLLQEMEILLAERRAAHAENLEVYDLRLMAVRPENLYSACIHSLSNKFRGIHMEGESGFMAMLNLLRAESHRLHLTEHDAYVEDYL